MSADQQAALGPLANDVYLHQETGDRFVRCVLVIPIADCDETLEWGVWCSLSDDNFERYTTTFDGSGQSMLGEMFGWFSSQCIGYPDTLNLKALVHPRDNGLRPLVELEPTDHPLAVDQRNGVTTARAIELAQPWLELLKCSSQGMPATFAPVMPAKAGTQAK